VGGGGGGGGRDGVGGGGREGEGEEVWGVGVRGEELCRIVIT